MIWKVWNAFFEVNKPTEFFILIKSYHFNSLKGSKHKSKPRKKERFNHEFVIK